MSKVNLALTLSVTGWLLLAAGCRTTPRAEPLGTTYRAMDKPEVWKVPAKTTAQFVNLKPGDIIISYDESPISDLNALREAEARAVDKTGTIKLVVMRDEQELILEAKPGELGFIPSAMRYTASLAKALEEIMAYFGQHGYYDWLAGLTGETFSINVLEEDCSSWGYNGKAANSLEEIENLTGLSFKPLWQATAETTGNPLPIFKNNLNQNDALLLVWGGWSGNPYLWGVASRFNPSDSTIYGYSLGNGNEQPLMLEKINAIYQVKCRNEVIPDPVELLTTVLDRALEEGLAASESGWHSGLEAYDIIVKKLNRFPMCAEGPEVATGHFYRLVWSLISNKESANQLLADIKVALPEKSSLIDEVMARNRSIIGKLEGIAATHLPFNSLENQQKLARVMVEIQSIENDLLGLYEEIIGEL
ncbi:MAG: hypothetical protein ACUVUD_03825 [bacterium]